MGAVAPAPAVDTTLVHVLWVDDEPEAIDSYRRLLGRERDKLGIEIDIATSIEVAQRKLDTGNYSAIVIDCKMDIYDWAANGAEFLLEINKTRKDLPTFVYSAFLDDPLYDDFLSKSYAILKVSKMGEFERPISKDPFFQTLSKRALQYSEVKHLHPEKIQFSNYLDNPAKFSAEADAHWQKHGHWIQVEMKRNNYAWCVVCGDNIVRISGNPFDFPNQETLRQIGFETNLIPFAYSATLAPEDSAELSGGDVLWKPTAFNDDYYPKLRVRIANTVVEDDFDTGAIRTHVSDALIQKGFLEFWRESDVGHLGTPYQFFSKTVPVSILGSEGGEHTRELAVTVVQDWDDSPFISVNRNRLCLLGRDLLYAFPVEIILDSRKRTTRVCLLRT